MLLNATHLLPDDSGALICPKLRLMAVADPLENLPPRQAAEQAQMVLRRLSGLLRQRRPATMLWLGEALPRLLAEDLLPRRDADELARMQRDTQWLWICDTPPAGWDQPCHDVWKMGGLTFRRTGQPSMAVGEISAQPAVFAPLDGQNWPCYVLDGRKMLLPPFGPQPGHQNALLPPAQSLFRRPFNALLLRNGKIVTKARSELDPPGGTTGPSRQKARIQPVAEPEIDLNGPPMRGTRMQLFKSDQ